MNCCVVPLAIDGLAGVTAIDCKVAAEIVSVAAVVVAEPTELVNTARYWLPLSAAWRREAQCRGSRTRDIAKRPPPLVLSCHWTVGVGLPLAAATNVAVDVALTTLYWSDSWSPWARSSRSSSRPSWSPCPLPLVKTARNLVPF